MGVYYQLRCIVREITKSPADIYPTRSRRTLTHTHTNIYVYIHIEIRNRCLRGVWSEYSLRNGGSAVAGRAELCSTHTQIHMNTAQGCMRRLRDWECVCVWVFVMRVCAPRIKQKIKISWLNFSLVGCDFSCLVAMLSLSLALAQGMPCALTLLRRFGNGQHSERVSVCVC